MKSRNRRRRNLNHYRHEPEPVIDNVPPKQIEKVEQIKIPKKQKPWYVFVCQRSGHTAILNWLCLQNRPCYFVDHCDWKLAPKVFVYKYNRADEKPEMLRGKKSRKNLTGLVFYAFENKKIADKYGRFDPERTIVIARSPYNWKASKWRGAERAFAKNHKVDEIINQFKEENDIYMSLLKKKNVYHIFYDNWFVDVKYRKRICADLNLRYENDRGLNQVLQASSFDSIRFDGKAQKMDVLYRYKKYENDHKFLAQVKPRMVRIWLEKLSEYGLKPLSDAPELIERT